jgi:hypothetical protein
VTAVTCRDPYALNRSWTLMKIPSSGGVAVRRNAGVGLTTATTRPSCLWQPPLQGGE